MTKQKVNIVWLKRDLRTQDHLPFFKAEEAKEDYLSIYIFEPSLIEYPDCSKRHLQFVYQSIEVMNALLSKNGRRVLVFYAEAAEVFVYLLEKFQINHVFSYQESGIRTSWNRDKEIAALLTASDTNWQEFQRDGIARGIQNRKSWDRQWHGIINAPVIENDYSDNSLEVENHPFALCKELEKELQNYPGTFQKPGELNAWRYLMSFCAERGRNYSWHISKPRESRRSCGRISPFLAWGNISIRQAYQFIKKHPNYSKYKRSFNGILMRLKWHCHFIQKFEMECDYETRCINRGYELLEYKNDEQLIKAWEGGKTGFPMVDACMRCLHATGWINFRMRAMLVSVFCHQFDCDWRKGVYHLAKLFLDYEPGIHYPQFQMQAGTTGVNTIRMYNPLKQSKDHDPKGIFIKEWITELQAVPEEFIHEPWTMTEMEKRLYKAEVYPDPVVDLVATSRLAREKIWGHRKHPKVRKESKRIVLRHTRNKKVKKKKARKKVSKSENPNL